MSESGAIFVKIRFLLPTLPKAEKHFAEYILENPERIVGLTLAELTVNSQCSESSIIRLAQRIGFSGFTELKKHIEVSLADNNVDEELDLSKCDSIEQIVSTVFKYNMRTLSDTLALVNHEYDKAINALINAKSVHFFGNGDAGLVGEFAHMKFLRLGIPGSAYNDSNLQVTVASTLQPGDVAIAITHSGRTRTTIDALQLSKESGATTICITNMDKSPATKYADIKLFTATTDLTIGSEFVSRRVAEQAVIEALYLSFLKESPRDYTKIIERTYSAFDRLK